MQQKWEGLWKVYELETHLQIEHSNACAGIPELPGITRNYPELGVPRETTFYGLYANFI